MKRPTVRWLMELLGDGWLVVAERSRGTTVKTNRHVWAHPQSPWFVVEVANALGAASDWAGLQMYVRAHRLSLDTLEEQKRLRVATFGEARRLCRSAELFEPDDDPSDFRSTIARKLLARQF